MIRTVLILVSVLSSNLLLAQYDIALSGAIEEERFTLRDLHFYQDHQGHLTFPEVADSGFESKFIRDPNYHKKEFDPNSVYWVKFRIKHERTQNRVWMLEFFDQTIDEIVAYIPDHQASYHTIVMGDNLDFPQRQLRHKNFGFVLDNQLEGIQTYYFRIHSQESADVRIVLRSMDQFLFWASSEYLLFGIFYGMLLIICFYNLLMYVATREGKYGVYIIYLISIAVYSASRDGIAFQYLWPYAQNWNQISIGVTIFTTALLAVIFTRSFLSTRINTPLLDKFLVIWMILRSAIFFYALLFDSQWFQYRVIECIPIMLILIASATMVLRGYKPARLMVIGHGVLFLTFIVKALTDNGLFPFSALSHYSLRLGFLAEMIFLSFALGDQIRLLKRKRDQALNEIIEQQEINANLKDKVNLELEGKVAARTKELEEKRKMLERANQKLIDQSNDINQINSLLDLQNWRLKNHIREILEERLVNKQLTYEEFQEIFPNRMECYKYLQKLKWNNGFQCRKCSNTKFFRGTRKFDHRCTRCGYNESITAHTIFKGIKFPIEKAFYILYTMATDHQEYTLKEMSRILNLRKNTIWAFKNKIVQAYHHEGPKHFFKVVEDLGPKAKPSNT